jgi:HEAT repeat protein
MDDLKDLLVALNSGDDEISENAACRLAGYGQAAFSALMEQATHRDADRRWWAFRALAEIPGEGALPALIHSLKDEDASVRQCAALGLQRHPHERAIPALLDSLSDSDPMLNWLAGNALAAVGVPATPALLERLPQASPKTRLEIMRVLALVGDENTIPALFEALDSDSMMVEYWANEGLERMGVGMVFFKP